MAFSVVVFTGGSSSVRWFAQVAKPLRWPVLFVLLAIALALARDRLRPVRLAAVEWAALGFVALAFLSTSWSVLPKLSLERSVSFGLLVLAAIALAASARGRLQRGRSIVAGLAAGASIVAVAGWVMLPFEPTVAAQAAGLSTPWRFRGFGENPNTIALLTAIAVPLVIWLLLSARAAIERAAWGIALVFFAATISLSGSRGAVIGGLVGVVGLVVAASPNWRRRVVAAATAAAVFAGLVVVSQVPKPLGPVQTAAQRPSPGAHGRPGTRGTVGPRRAVPAAPVQSFGLVSGTSLDNELKPTSSTRRQLFGSSGRVQAWEWALGEARKRPVVGYGFGTESNVFVDRLYAFDGGVPENSYIGVTMQLGAVGLAALCAVILAAALAGRAAVRALPWGSAARGLAGACAGAALAGVTIALVQSYLYAAGNLATLTVWTSALLVADAARTWGTAA